MKNLKIKRIIVGDTKHPYGVTIAYREDLERGHYECAFSFLNPLDNHCKRIGREIAINRFRNNKTFLIDGHLDIQEGCIDNVADSVMLYFDTFTLAINFENFFILEKGFQFPRWLPLLVDAWYWQEK